MCDPRERETYAEQHGDDRETVLGAVGKDARCLPADGEAVQDARGAEEERVAGGERAGEDGRVDDGGQRLDAGAADRDDVGRLRGGAGAVEQVGVVVGHEHAGDQDAEDVEDDDAPEDAADGLGDVPPWVFRLGRGTVRKEVFFLKKRWLGSTRMRGASVVFELTSRRAPFPGRRSRPARGRPANLGSDPWLYP